MQKEYSMPLLYILWKTNFCSRVVNANIKERSRYHSFFFQLIIKTSIALYTYYISRLPKYYAAQLLNAFLALLFYRKRQKKKYENRSCLRVFLVLLLQKCLYVHNAGLYLHTSRSSIIYRH